MKTTKLKLILLCFATFILASCVTKINMDEIGEENTYSPSLALPIGFVHANILDLLENIDSEYVTIDSTNAICILWEEKDVNIDINIDKFIEGDIVHSEIMLSAEDVFNSEFNKLPIEINEITIPAGEYLIEKEIDYQFGFNEYTVGEVEVRIDSILVKSANVEFNTLISGVTIDKNNYMELSFEYPNIIDGANDNVFTNLRIDQMEQKHINPMDFFTAYFTNDNINNKTKMKLSFKFVSDGTAKITRNARISFNTSINDINFYEVYGFGWQKEPSASQEFSIDVPANIINMPLLKDNNLLFANPQLTLELNTNIGVPASFNIEELYAIVDGEKIVAKFNDKQNTSIYLNIPTTPHDSALTIVNLNKEYGTLHTLLSALPESIHCKWNANTTQEKDANTNQFLVDPVKITADIKAEVPLQFDATTSFSYNDTIDFDMQSIIGADTIILNDINIDTLSLYLDISNMLPATTILQLCYLDEKNHIIKETKEFEIESAIVDEEGRSVSPNKQTLIINSNNEDIIDIINTKKVILKLRLQGTDEKAKIYFQSTDSIDIKISTFIKTNMELGNIVN